MSNYYSSSPHPSMHGHQPTYAPSNQQYYGNGYLSPQPQYANGGYVVSDHSRHSSRRSHRSQPRVRSFYAKKKNLITELTRVYQYDSHRSHSRHGHSRPRQSHHHHHHRSLGERILRWFGIGRHKSSHHRSQKGWSFFGNKPRTRYVDSQGMEVDRHGRRLYKV